MATFKNIPYYSNSSAQIQDPKQTLDLYLPSSQFPEGPILIYVHGGAWRTGDKSEYETLGRRLADAGNFAVAVINYRLSLKEFEDKGYPLHHPAHLQDCAAAVSFIAQNGSKYGYRGDRIYLSGHSAGGTLTGGLVLIPEYLNEAQTLDMKSNHLLGCIRGVVGVQGIYDIPRLLETWPSYRDFIEQAFGKDPSRYELASPQYHRPASGSSRLPAYLVIYSLEDELVDLEQSRRYYRHVLKCGAFPLAELDTLLKGMHFPMLQTDEFARRVSKFVWDVEKALKPRKSKY